MPEVTRIKRSWMEIALFGLIFLGLFYLYGLRGNTDEVELRGHSAMVWMFVRWRGLGGDLSHGWLIPLVSAFAIWKKRGELFAAPRSVNWYGLAVIVLCLCLHWLGVRSQQTRISLLSLIGLLWGIPLYLYGGPTARILLFPCAYLAFCIPLSFLNSLTVPLRILASTVSTHLLNGLGIMAVRTGTMICSVPPGAFNLGVDDPCSGLRSLLAMAALTAVYAYFTQKTMAGKWILFFAAVPLAMVGNITRIVLVASTAYLVGQEFATGLNETFAGLVVFSVAVLLMVGIGKLLNSGMVRERLT